MSVSISEKRLILLEFFWSHPSDSNRRPADYEPLLLTNSYAIIITNRFAGFLLPAQLIQNQQCYGPVFDPKGWGLTSHGRDLVWIPLSTLHHHATVRATLPFCGLYSYASRA
jgi:hypothetical protein